MIPKKNDRVDSGKKIEVHFGVALIKRWSNTKAHKKK